MNRRARMKRADGEKKRARKVCRKQMAANNGVKWTRAELAHSIEKDRKFAEKRGLVRQYKMQLHRKIAAAADASTASAFAGRSVVTRGEERLAMMQIEKGEAWQTNSINAPVRLTTEQIMHKRRRSEMRGEQVHFHCTGRTPRVSKTNERRVCRRMASAAFTSRCALRFTKSTR